MLGAFPYRVSQLFRCARATPPDARLDGRPGMAIRPANGVREAPPLAEHVRLRRIPALRYRPPWERVDTDGSYHSRDRGRSLPPGRGSDRDALVANPRLVLGLATGRTMESLYALLATKFE